MEPAELIEHWERATLALVPDGADVFDAHVHLGTDIGGVIGRPAPLLATMDRYGVSRCNVFCLDEPDREPAFRAGNDRTLAFAAEAPDRFVPFVRLDLTEGPVEEAERCLDLGARGIKLHPRAQRFELGDDRLEPVFAVAAERRVPILLHGGLGLPPIADALHRLAERHPAAQLIVAHAGIADMGALTDRLGGRPGVFFDTSTWSATDLIALLARVSPEQVLYASDFPYGQQPGFLLVLLRAAAAAGLREPDVREILAGNANRIADAEPPLAPTAARGRQEYTQPVDMARIARYAAGAMALLWSAQPDRLNLLGLALNACGEDAGDLRALLEAASTEWRRIPELPPEERRAASRSVFRLLHIADVLTSTAPA